MRQRVQQVALDKTRILSCDWDEHGGSLVYDISHLHPEWSQLVQTYRIDSQTYGGHYIYTSEFRLYKRGEDVASDLAAYPKPLKAELWKIVYAVKDKFFEEVQPAIVTHFIKQPYSVGKRSRNYRKYLSFPNYDIVCSGSDITYFRKDVGYEPDMID